MPRSNENRNLKLDCEKIQLKIKLISIITIVSRELKMIIITPRPNMNNESLGEKLSPENLFDYTKLLKSKPVFVFTPKWMKRYFLC